jgi:hypothetical protein
VVTEELEARIEALTEERRYRWRRGMGVKAISAELERTWAELRRLRAEEINGPTADIINRARVERELEKLMAEEA